MKGRLVGPTLIFPAVLAVALDLLPSPARAFHEAAVHVEAGAWFPSLAAEARSSSFGIAGRLVTDGDLGLDGPDVVLIRCAGYGGLRAGTLAGIRPTWAGAPALGAAEARR